MVGTVSNVIAPKKFGFILGDNAQEYFFHASEVISNWEQLEALFSKYGKGTIKVTFEPVKTDKGPRAKNVTLFPDRD